MKTFKEFLTEAHPEWRVSFKKQKLNGVDIDEKPVNVKARDSREAIVKAAKKLGISDKSQAMQLKTKDIKNLNESEDDLTVTVAVRDARKANELARDMFRGDFEQDGSNTFTFEDEDTYYEFIDALEGQGIEVID